MGRKQNHPDAECASRFRVGSGLYFLLLLSPVSCLLTPGCKPNKRYDLIEAELRTRERELMETRAALEQSRNLNRAYVQQSQLAAAGPQVPDPTRPVYVPVKEIALARGTGGVDEDGVPGDDGLMVVVVPRDADGSAVKVPAKVEIAAWEVSDAGIKHHIGTWEVPAEKVRPTWRSGFVSTGYFVAVPWQTYPAAEKVRVAVRLTTLDGRAFEADRDMLVKLCRAPVPTAPTTPTALPASPVPVPAPGRPPLYPDPLPSGAGPVPLGTEELPPPMPAERGARLGPPEPQQAHGS